MAFTNEDGVMGIFESMMVEIFHEILGHDLPTPIHRLEYSEAMDRFGTDRPDVRFGMELIDLSDIAARSDFRVFKRVIEEGGVVKAISVKQAAPVLSRKNLDELSRQAVDWGAKGLAWIKVTENGWQSSLDKFFGDEDKSQLEQKVEARPGDLILIVADKVEIVNESLGMLRLNVAEHLDLIDENDYAFIWITRFPLFEYNETESRLEAVHHPFTAPLEEDISLLDDYPEQARARSYDLVLNGAEIGGGSVRIHNISIQQKIFSILGISPEEAQSKFGFLLEALRYGAPPHGGMALGFDRLVAIMTGVKSIREVIAFPKTTSATCPLTGAPSSVDEEQLKELALRPFH
jgi:aspartyl-tRNA synthetase